MRMRMHWSYSVCGCVQTDVAPRSKLATLGASAKTPRVNRAKRVALGRFSRAQAGSSARFLQSATAGAAVRPFGTPNLRLAGRFCAE